MLGTQCPQAKWPRLSRLAPRRRSPAGRSRFGGHENLKKVSSVIFQVCIYVCIYWFIVFVCYVDVFNVMFVLIGVVCMFVFAFCVWCYRCYVLMLWILQIARGLRCGARRLSCGARTPVRVRVVQSARRLCCGARRLVCGALRPARVRMFQSVRSLAYACFSTKCFVLPQGTGRFGPP